VGDLLVEGVDIDGRVQPGFAPCLLPECLGEPFLEVLYSGVEPVGALVRGEEVGLQGGSGDRRAGAVTGSGWLGVGGVDLLEQVAVSVEEAAVDAGRAGGGGHADPGAIGDGAVGTRWRRRAVSACRPARIAWVLVFAVVVVLPAGRLLVVLTRWPPRSWW
jgi:hypothetical protein